MTIPHPAHTSHESGTVLVGCAGWSIARVSAPHFPAEGSGLERYAAVMNCAEINSSFYRPHQPKTYAKWADSVPATFRFSVKLPRTISHDGKLKDITELLDQFAGEAGALGEKLGCVLVQLPPSLKFDAGIVGDFFALVRARFRCMIACEGRHPTWFDDDATGVLQAHAVTRVIADPAKGQPGPHVPTTAASYRRLHGSPRVYYSSYDDAYLAQVAEEVKLAAAGGADAWIIFDNTASGAAVNNALDLRALASRAGAASTSPHGPPG